MVMPTVYRRHGLMLRRRRFRQRLHAKLHELARMVGPRSRPGADLSAAARDAVGEAARQDVPAEVAVVGGRPRQRIGIAGKDLVADGAQAFAENLADVGMLAGTLDDVGHRVVMNVADSELLQV